MSYANIKPEYYRMHQPDSPWHAGAPGWKSAPWPGWGQNPNLVGPPRLAVEGLGHVRGASMYQQVKGVGEYFQGGLGAYYAPEYDRAVSGLGSSMRNAAGTGCGCSGMGDTAATTSTSPSSVNSSTKGALMIAGLAVVMMALIAVPSIWDE